MSQALRLFLPKNWSIARLEDLVNNFVGGGTPSKQKSAYYQGNIPWITVKDMTTRRPHAVIDYITPEAVKNSSTNLIPPDTIIIATRMGLGKIVRVPFEVAINQDLKALILPKDIDKDFLEYWLLAKASDLQSLGKGSTVQGIRLEVLRQLEILLPPRNEQRRIVAKIEALMARSQRAKEAIEAIPLLLEQFRQSVLAAAFRGDLTADWREKNPDVEPASVSLDHIRAERRRRWEKAELERMKADGRTPKDDKWKSKYVEPEIVQEATLPALPDGWCWLTLELVADAIDPQPSHRTPPEVSQGVPYIGIGDIRNNGAIDFAGARKVSPEVLREHRQRYSLKDGDFIFGKIGTLGKPARLPLHFDYTISANVILVQPRSLFVISSWLFYFLLGASHFGKNIRLPVGH